MRNPFRDHQPLLPSPVADNLRALEQIVVRHLDEVVCEPPSNL